MVDLVDRVLLLSHPQFHQKNFSKAIETLLNNGNPLTLIFTTINDRIKYHFHNNQKKTAPLTVDKFFTVPYIKSISESFQSHLVYIRRQLIQYLTCLTDLLRLSKDKLSFMSQQDVVYKISCHDCDASYVGQTKRKLLTRVREHRSNINKKTGSPSVISNHRITHGHDFDWSNVKILDIEPSYNKRMTSEMLHIKRQNNGLNLQNDTISFPDAHLSLLGRLPSF
ncbi:hypothetical protein ALC57_05566 [Trachymyrmex cornetzi]|uniref:Helix-turn-helix domain-containing protein n=1 Tax=Trachymyrmex cornetzi TaxID=471704 RepID=A0A151JAI4_9HYME|nr:hypothetical protein ALC57_05566 [Trachymyrmex cornetzi]